MAEHILVYVGHRNEQVIRPSLEALSEARRIADANGFSVSAVVVGVEGNDLPSECAYYGADTVYVIRDAALRQYSSDGYAQALKSIVDELNPLIMLFSADSMGKDLSPVLAAKLEAGLATDCTGIWIDDGHVNVKRPMYAGKAYATVRFKATPQLVSLRPKVFDLGERNAKRRAEVIERDLGTQEQDLRAHVIDVVQSGKQQLDVSEADIIVSGGRGLGGQEHFDIIEDLADTLHAAVGASRAAVDAGWIDHQHQVGQTGKIVNPTLYIACGISGAIQHQVGMKNAKFIVAINKDPDAPIFQLADYGIVGDLFEIVPALTKKLKEVVQ